MENLKSNTDVDTKGGPRWGHVAAFLALTFGLTWLLNLSMYLRGGLRVPGIVTSLQLQMLIPAFSAIVLGLFVFRESPIYRGRPAGRGRWFYYYFLLVVVVYVIEALRSWLMPSAGAGLLAVLPLMLAVLGLLMLIVLRWSAGREAMARVWLSWGKGRDWLLFGLAFAAFYVLQGVLNAVFGLGGTKLAAPSPPAGLSPQTFLIAAVAQSMLLSPFLAIVIALGEEYGWRGYLQSELFKMGRVRGVLLLGVIWGAWHWPVILMGFNYPGHPLLGVVLMTLYTTGIGVALSYAVLRSGSVLLSAYLHALNNQVVGVLVFLGFGPHDAAFSFGIGVYAIAMLAIIAVLILRDPIWRGRGGGLSEA